MSYNPSSGGVTEFIDLTDAPASYSGQAGKFVKVNAGATALEFATLAGGGDMLSTNNLSDVANAATARTNLGVGTGDSPQFTAINLGHASDTTITRVSAGVIAVEGVNVVTTNGGVTFANDITVPAEIYGAGWNGSNEVPTKNDVYDKIEALQAAFLLAAYPVGAIYTSVVSTSPATLFGGTWSAFGAGRVMVGIDAGQTEFDTVEETGGAKTHTLTTAEMPSHTHTQDSHNHTQDSHNHTQNAHTHTQDAHNHTQRYQATTTGAGSGPTTAPDTSSSNTTNYGITTADTTATNQNTTATNQATTATNQATTATNQNTGGGGAHNNLQPYIVVYMWKRTA